MTENIFNKWKKGLEKTRKVTFGRIANFLGTSELNDNTWDELEALLLQADMGFETTDSVIQAVKTAVKEQGLTHNDEVLQALKDELLTRLAEPNLPDFSIHPTVIILVGVNGSGKTTSAAKLAHLYQEEGKSLLW